MSTWLIPRDELTPDQLRAIESGASENQVILGGPGSGKTQILLHRAQLLRERLGVSPDRFHIFVYTNALRSYIQSALTLLDIPAESVSTLDSWCMNFYRERIGGRAPWNYDQKCPDFGAIRRAVLMKLRASPAKPFAFVLVDEAQDLDEDAFQLFAAMANHVTACADHRQQIYDHGSEIGAILQWLGLRRSNVTLLETYRCCPYIVKLASNLIDDAVEREAYVRQAKTSQDARETPLLYCARNADDEKRQLVDIIRTRLARGERIAVLFPQQRQAYGYATGLTEEGIEVENPKELDFGTDKPKLMPYHSAKGLTFDAVLMPRLVDMAFGGMGAHRILKVLFVGITRATRWVYLSTVANAGFAPMERLAAGAASGCLTVRNHQQANYVPPPTAKPKPEDDALGLL
jgi:superfamily I DNA/RNA helicase